MNTFRLLITVFLRYLNFKDFKNLYNKECLTYLQFKLNYIESNLHLINDKELMPIYNYPIC